MVLNGKVKSGFVALALLVVSNVLGVVLLQNGANSIFGLYAQLMLVKFFFVVSSAVLIARKGV